jgi:hypothetical protein
LYSLPAYFHAEFGHHAARAVEDVISQKLLFNITGDDKPMFRYPSTNSVNLCRFVSRYCLQGSAETMSPTVSDAVLRVMGWMPSAVVRSSPEARTETKVDAEPALRDVVGGAFEQAGPAAAVPFAKVYDCCVEALPLTSQIVPQSELGWTVYWYSLLNLTLHNDRFKQSGYAPVHTRAHVHARAVFTVESAHRDRAPTFLALVQLESDGKVLCLPWKPDVCVFQDDALPVPAALIGTAPAAAAATAAGGGVGRPPTKSFHDPLWLPLFIGENKNGDPDNKKSDV